MGNLKQAVPPFIVADVSRTLRFFHSEDLRDRYLDEANKMAQRLAPTIKEVGKWHECIKEAKDEYVTAVDAYAAFLKEEAANIEEELQRWNKRMYDVVQAWKGNGKGGSFFVERAMERIQAKLSPERTAELIEQVAAKQKKTAALPYISGGELKGITEDRENAKFKTELAKQFNMEMYEDTYIELRNAHIGAIENVIYSLGPYTTASGAYGSALKAMANSVDCTRTDSDPAESTDTEAGYYNCGVERSDLVRDPEKLKEWKEKAIETANSA